MCMLLKFPSVAELQAVAAEHSESFRNQRFHVDEAEETLMAWNEKWDHRSAEQVIK